MLSCLVQVSTQGWNFDVYLDGNLDLIGGTSASSPTFASVIALINDQLVAAGKPVLGFLNPWLYSTASDAFTDITEGKNVGFTCPDSAVAFEATTGWDPVTGKIIMPWFDSLLMGLEQVGERPCSRSSWLRRLLERYSHRK